jgi:hypothetical protein
MEVVGKKGEARTDPEEKGKEMGELPQELYGKGCPGHLSDFIESAFRKPLCCLCIGKAIF